MENIQLNLLKDEIEKLEKFHQIQILIKELPTKTINL